MNKLELDKILELHKKWMNGDPDGQRADLCGANLRGVNLRNADLHGVNLRGVNLRNADLHGADLHDVNLRGVNLRNADLRGADLRGADLDYSCFPLWCGGLSVHLDDKQIKQMLYHTVQNALYSKNTSDKVKQILGRADIMQLANEFHRVDECGKLGVVPNETR